MNWKNHIWSHMAVAIIFFFVGVFVVNQQYSKSENLQIAETSPTTDLPDPNNLLTLPTVNKKQDEVKNPITHELEKEVKSKIYYLQLGSFKVDYFSSQLIKKLNSENFKVHHYRTTVHNINFNIVEVGPYTSYFKAIEDRKNLEEKYPSLGKILIKKRFQ